MRYDLKVCDFLTFAFDDQVFPYLIHNNRIVEVNKNGIETVTLGQ